MKKLKYFIAICNIALSGIAHAQNNVTDPQAIQMLKEFYTIYNTTWSSNKYEVAVKKLHALQKQYCTTRLSNELKNNDLDQDPIVGGLITDVKHLKTLDVTKDPGKANVYTVSYTAPDGPLETKMVLHVTVAKENGSYKIALVKYK